MPDYTIAVSNVNLPTGINDLSKFVLIGREKLNAVRAEIRAIEKVGLAKEVHDQKLAEAQEIGEAVLDAEVRLGELMAKLPKATPNNNPYHESCTTETFVKPKIDVIQEAGFTKAQAHRFETLAAHPEYVEQAKAEARENGDIVTRAAVFQKIERPHVSYNSRNNEWYTPFEYIEAARTAMGSIDLDPASSELANKTVKATVFYTIEDDGLKKPWFGNVWLNPPYSGDLVGRFIDKITQREYEQACVLVNNATETVWFRSLVTIAKAIVFTSGRIRYNSPNGPANTPLQGQAIAYVGSNIDGFFRAFDGFGWEARIV